MAPSLNDTFPSSAVNTSTFSPDLPLSDTTQLVVLKVSVVTSGAAVTINTPVGWSLLTAGLAQPEQFFASAVFYKTGGPGLSVTLTTSIAVAWFAVEACVYDNVDVTGTPIDANAKSTHTSGTSHTVGGITTTVANTLLVQYYGLNMGDTNPPSGSGTLVDNRVLIGDASQSFLVLGQYLAHEVKTTAGATGTRTLTTVASGVSANYLFALRPFLGPSLPLVTFANGGESLTAGSTVTVTCTAATSPTVAQSALTYEFSYSANNGGTWTVIGSSAAGVTSRSWTVPATTGSGYRLRVRAFDGTLFSATYDESNSAFSVVAETQPGQPTITAPSAGSVQNKAANVTVSWTHQGGVGNPQTEFELQWDDNSGFTSPTTVGPTATATQSTSIDFSALASGTTVYVKVKTRGLSLYSAFSNVTAFTVASIPATPNITAPVAASPPTEPLPTITFTSADSFVARRFRVGTNTFEAMSTATSFTSPYTFLNGVAVQFFLSVKNTFGLWSAEDSETVTPAYTGPATPTLTVQADSAGGAIRAQISNSDTPVYNELWRYEYRAGRDTAIKVGANLPVDPSFADSNVVSGTVYQYFARAYAATGLFSDSVDSAVIYLDLDSARIHIVSRTLTNSNATNALTLFLEDGSEFGLEEVAASHKLLGRSKPVGVAGQATWQTARLVGVGINDGTLAGLMVLWRLGALVCLRTPQGHRIFGRMTEPQSSVSVENVNLDAFSFTVTEEDYSEGL